MLLFGLESTVLCALLVDIANNMLQPDLTASLIHSRILSPQHVSFTLHLLLNPLTDYSIVVRCV